MINFNEANDSNYIETNYRPTIGPFQHPTTLAYRHQQIDRQFYDSSDLPVTTSMEIKNYGQSQGSLQYPFEQSRLPQQRNYHIAARNTAPSNHRRQYVETKDAPRSFGHVLNGNRPTSFKPRVNISFPNIPKDYSGHVDSIQDIISQISDQIQDERIESLPAYVARTGRKVWFGGKYRHRKNDDIPPQQLKKSPSLYLSDPSRSPLAPTPTPPTIGDPFYPYKPQSMADINLMAMNEFRFAPNPINFGSKSQRENSKKSNNHNYVASEIYQQIIRENNMRDEADRMASRDAQTKHKPFSLMLDVYPMHDDEAPLSLSSTRRPDIRPVIRRPMPHEYSNNAHNAVKNFPLHYEQQYFKNLKFPQINSYRTQVKPYYHERDNVQSTQYSNYNFNRLGSVHQIPPSTENRPSQITVHLNLFPKHKSPQLHQRRDGTRFSGLSNVDLWPSVQRNRSFGRIGSTSKPDVLEDIAAQYDDNILNPSSNDFQSTNVQTTKPDERLVTHPLHKDLTPITTIHPSHQSQNSETILPNLHEEAHTNSPESATQNPTSSPTFLPDNNNCIEPKIRLQFDDRFDFQIPTVIPIDPRNLREIPSSEQ